MASNFQSFNESSLGGFIESPLSARGLDSGPQSTLIAGGAFTTAGGNAANRIASWNGTAWSALGSGMNAIVRALVVYDDCLIAGGYFTTAGGGAAAGVAKWDGSSWSALGAGVNGTVFALAVYDGALIAGGNFTTAGGGAASRIAKWDGSSWSALGAGVDANVYALKVIGSDLYVGGNFTTAGGAAAARVAKWDGAAWSEAATGLDNPNTQCFALAEYDSMPHAGGNLVILGESLMIARAISGIWKWGFGLRYPDASVRAFYVDTQSNLLVLGGAFTSFLGSGPAPTPTPWYIAWWSGSSWSYLASSYLNGTVYGVTKYDGEIIAGGAFSGGSSSAHITLLSENGDWSGLDGGMNDTVWTVGIY